jgi:uncharacterized C2H2 Zn-finger protein
MPIYECEKCGFKTENKKDYQKHLKTKKHLKNVGELDNDENLSYTPNIPFCAISEDMFECDFCNATFKHKSGKYRHQNQNCKVKKSQIAIIEQMRSEMREQEVRYTKHMMMQEERHTEQMKELMKLTEIALSKPSGGNRNCNNTTNNNIIIHAYGKEDISFLKDKDFLEMLNNSGTSVQTLVKKIHFNEEHPENKNVKITNKKQPYAKVYNGDKWLIKDKKETITNLVEDKMNLLDSKFDELQGDMTPFKQERHIDFHENTSDEMLDYVKKEVELCVMNG